MKHLEKHPSYVDGCFACRMSTVGFNGMVALDQFRRLGETQRQFTYESNSRFEAEHGYPPEKA